MSLYHGSPFKHKHLIVKESSIVNNESVVYATDVYDIAVLFAAKISDLHIECGSVNGKFYALEKYQKAFKNLERSGYIHLVSDETFKRDDRLGMNRHEFISHKNVAVENVVYVANIYKYLKEESKIVNLITWEQMIEQIESLMKK